MSLMHMQGTGLQMGECVGLRCWDGIYSSFTGGEGVRGANQDTHRSLALCLQLGLLIDDQVIISIELDIQPSEDNDHSNE